MCTWRDVLAVSFRFRYTQMASSQFGEPENLALQMCRHGGTAMRGDG